MEKAMWRVVGRWEQQPDGKWYRAAVYAGTYGGRTSSEAAEAWAKDSFRHLRLPRPEAFLQVQYPAPHGLVDVFVKVRPLVVYDCEQVYLNKQEFAE